MGTGGHSPVLQGWGPRASVRWALDVPGVRADLPGIDGRNNSCLLPGRDTHVPGTPLSPWPTWVTQRLCSEVPTLGWVIQFPPGHSGSQAPSRWVRTMGSLLTPSHPTCTQPLGPIWGLPWSTKKGRRGHQAPGSARGLHPPQFPGHLTHVEAGAGIRELQARSSETRSATCQMELRQCQPTLATGGRKGLHVPRSENQSTFHPLLDNCFPSPCLPCHFCTTQTTIFFFFFFFQTTIFKRAFRDFPGGPVGKILRSHCRGPKFDTWSGN